MKIDATISVDCDGLYDALVPETEGKEFKRASWTIEKRGGKSLITITARDPTAFKAMLNSVVRGLTLFEKARGIR